MADPIFWVSLFSTWWVQQQLTLFANNVGLYNTDLQTTTVLFTHKGTSYKADWILTASYLLCRCKQSDENTWSRTLVVSPSWELYRNFIAFVYFVHIAFPLTCICPFLSYWCCWFTCNKFVVFVCVAFAHFNVKRCYTASIFVTTYCIDDCPSTDFWQKLSQ